MGASRDFATVILPVHNEEKTVASVFDRVCSFGREHPDYRILFVDDGSSDQTRSILERKILRCGGDQIKLIACESNLGKAAAIRRSMAQATGERICFTDGDLAYSLNQVEQLIEALDKHDIVIGSRWLADRPQVRISACRKIFGMTFNLLVRLILSLPYRDTQAGLKGFRREAAERLFAVQRVNDFAFDAELLFLAHYFGYRVGQIPATVSKHHFYHASKIGFWIDPLKMLTSLVRIRFNALTGKYGKEKGERR